MEKDSGSLLDVLQRKGAADRHLHAALGDPDQDLPQRAPENLLREGGVREKGSMGHRSQESIANVTSGAMSVAMTAAGLTSGRCLRYIPQ